jgi:peptidoglycan/xylan/chitin deacetylase (PgdA/CDA1 family)
MHLVTLSFDDGFIASNRKIATLYERHGLSACFNIVAAQAEAPNAYMVTNLMGHIDHPLWNELQARGHEIMPHGLVHENYAALPLVEAQDSVRRCLELFAEHLHNFDARQAVFNMPYNASTTELNAWLSTQVRAVRTACPGDGINPLPRRDLVLLSTTGFGPSNCDAHLDARIDHLLALPDGWLLYCAHGLDDEGWGPLSAGYLERLLDRLVAIPSVRILPAGRALHEWTT